MNVLKARVAVLGTRTAEWSVTAQSGLAQEATIHLLQPIAHCCADAPGGGPPLFTTSHGSPTDGKDSDTHEEDDRPACANQEAAAVAGKAGSWNSKVDPKVRSKRKQVYPFEILLHAFWRRYIVHAWNSRDCGARLRPLNSQSSEEAKKGVKFGPRVLTALVETNKRLDPEMHARSAPEALKPTKRSEERRKKRTWFGLLCRCLPTAKQQHESEQRANRRRVLGIASALLLRCRARIAGRDSHPGSSPRRSRPHRCRLGMDSSSHSSSIATSVASHSSGASSLGAAHSLEAITRRARANRLPGVRPVVAFVWAQVGLSAGHQHREQAAPCTAPGFERARSAPHIVQPLEPVELGVARTEYWPNSQRRHWSLLGSGSYPSPQTHLPSAARTSPKGQLTPEA
eukprot:3142399-Prymnesium_polylepis.2